MDSLRLSYPLSSYGGRRVGMHTVTSFHAADIEPGQLSAVMADYFALERARIYRRLCVTRFGILAVVLGIAGFGLRWLPPVASWVGVALCTVPATWAWIAEMRYDWRLARRLRELPERATQVGPAGPLA
jgi:Flp pilus assembly protein TadB